MSKQYHRAVDGARVSPPKNGELLIAEGAGDACGGGWRVTVHDTAGVSDNGDWPCTVQLEFGGQHGLGPYRGSYESEPVVFHFVGPNIEWQSLPEMLTEIGAALARIRDSGILRNV